MNTTRTEQFIPLNAPASPGSGETGRVTIIAQAENVRPFRPLEAAALEKARTTEEPKVEIQRRGTEVTGIEIRCTCGRAVHLSCEYEAAAGKGAGPNSGKA